MHRWELKQLNAVAQMAKADAQRRRSPVVIALVVVILLSPFALVVWWVWPGPPPAALVLGSYDQVALPDEPVLLCAQLEAVGSAAAAEDLSGHTVYLQDSKTDQVLGTRTGRDGRVTIERRYLPSEAPAEIVVRFAGDGQRRGCQARSRVFIWSVDAPLLLVDADHTLAAAEERELWTANNLTLPARPDAARALRALRAAYRVVYLTAGADRPTRYLKLRAWLERGWASPEQQFPDGPLLASGMEPEANQPTFYHQLCGTVKRRFTGTVVGVAGRAVEAAALRDAGVGAFLLGETVEAPPGVTVLPSWPAVVKRLLGQTIEEVTK